MKKIPLGKSGLEVSALALGCMRMAGCDDGKAADVVKAAVESGITFFDHADIYGGGDSERIFARAVRAAGIDREEIHIQSKCAIRDGYFDFSKEHIVESVDGILKRLQTDYLDVLALHRPDALMEPEEVAAAFSQLEQQGKVRHFGVSNQNPGQIELLRKAVKQALVVNQLQLGLGHTLLIDRGFNVNMANTAATDRDGGVLDYCRLHDMTVQAWSPLLFGFFKGVIIGHGDFAELNAVLGRIAAEQDADPSAVAIAWLLRHPARIQPILGSMTPARIRTMAKSTDISLTRAEWYELYGAAGNTLP